VRVRVLVRVHNSTYRQRQQVATFSKTEEENFWTRHINDQ